MQAESLPKDQNRAPRSAARSFIIENNRFYSHNASFRVTVAAALSDAVERRNEVVESVVESRIACCSFNELWHAQRTEPHALDDRRLAETILSANLLTLTQLSYVMHPTAFGYH